MQKILGVRVIIFLSMLLALSAMAADTPNIEPSVKTNENKQTDYFKNNMEDFKLYESTLKNYGNNQLNNMDFKAGDFGYTQEQVNSVQFELESIDPGDLETRGRQKAHEERELLEYLHPDYNSAANKMHMKNAEDIAEITLKSLTDLELVLHDIGIECKDRGGNIKSKPEDKKEQKEYHICQERVGEYSCTNYLTLECAEYGYKYGPWQRRSITLDGHNLYYNYKEIGTGVFWKSGRTGWHLMHSHPILQRIIAEKLSVQLAQINQTVYPSGRGHGSLSHLERLSNYQVWKYYNVAYDYRDKYRICKRWHESWQESCSGARVSAVGGRE